MPEDGRTTRITVQVKPRSSRDAVEGWKGDVLVVRLTAPPVEGAANESLVRVLADRLGLPRSALRIVVGGRSRSKVVEVRGMAPREIREALG